MKSMKNLRIRPEQQGLRVQLFDLEAAIMEIVWAKDWTQFAVAEVQKELAATRDLAYTTVMTTVSRLHEKGLLDRVREGRRYVYRPRMSHAEFSQAMARDLLGSLSGVGHDHALALLVDEVADSDADELQKLEAMIAKRKQELAK